MGIIETKNLTKSYGKSRGIIDLNLNVKEGEIYGFIGPNGAGKSTTIRTLLSLIKKTSGEATIFGLDCEKDRVKILQNVGYLPSEIFYYDNMKAIDLLQYSASFYKKDCTARIKELSQRLDLDLHKKIEDMSLGNKKKVGIIQGLLHDPSLIILDEPTSGLDPLMQRTFFQLIEEENKRGKTVLFSSHILSEVQKISHRVGIIKEGRLILDQSIAELKKDAYKNVSIHFENLKPERLNIEGIGECSPVGNGYRFLYRGNINHLVGKLGEYQLTDLDISEPTLEEIFMHYYQ